MPTLKNISSKTWQDLRPEASRDFSAEEMNSDLVKRGLRMGLLIESGPASNEQASDTRQTQQRPPTRR